MHKKKPLRPRHARYVCSAVMAGPGCIIERSQTIFLRLSAMAISGIAAIPALKEVYTQLKTRMDKAVEDFRANLAAARTGRATVNMLDPVRVPYYGSEMPLNQVATVHSPEAQL